MQGLNFAQVVKIVGIIVTFVAEIIIVMTLIVRIVVIFVTL